MKHKLTPGFVANPPTPAPGKDRITYWEGNFGPMVTAGGHKSYVIQYRADVKSWRMSLADGLTLREARPEAKAVSCGRHLGAGQKTAWFLGRRTAR